ncbi:MAG: hypothetical protein JO040_12885 [Gemmatimonadetes bacterium]|nr:hypothetical protein [Gemmatimonadota bacterium]
MRRWLNRCGWTAPALLAALAGCGDDGTGTRALTPDEVGGNYRICSLVFTPEGGFPAAVDIRAAAMNTGADATVPPRLTLSRVQNEFEVEYTPRTDVLPRRLGHVYSTSDETVTLEFDAAANAMTSLLLPPRLELTFQESPRELRISSAHARHLVSKADYEFLAGRSYPNVAPQVVGELSGRFATGPC